MMKSGEAMRDETVVVGLLKVTYKGIRRNITKGRILLNREYEMWVSDVRTVRETREERRMRSEMNEWVKEGKKGETDLKEGKMKRLVELYKSKPTRKTKRRVEEDMLSGVRYKDEDMVKMGVVIDADDENGVEKLVAGNVRLDEDEKAVLGLPPAYALYEKLSKLRFKCDTEETNCKRRYGRRKLDDEKDLSEDEKKTKDEDDLRARTVHEVGSGSCNFGKRRATDYKRNKRIKLPRAKCVGEESELEVTKGESSCD